MSIRTIKLTPIPSVNRPIKSSILALPLKVVRMLPEPDIASPLPVTKTRKVKIKAAKIANPRITRNAVDKADRLYRY